jgi:hypothetical protein
MPALTTAFSAREAAEAALIGQSSMSRSQPSRLRPGRSQSRRSQPWYLPFSLLSRRRLYLSSSQALARSLEQARAVSEEAEVRPHRRLILVSFLLANVAFWLLLGWAVLK